MFGSCYYVRIRCRMPYPQRVVKEEMPRMGDDPGARDSRRPFEPIAPRVGAEVQWPDLADRVALGMEDPWEGRPPRVDPPGHGEVLETPFLAAGYAEDWERLERYAMRQRFRAGEVIIGLGHSERSLIIVVNGQ